MAKKSFLEKLIKKWSEKKFVCAGLDSDRSKVPQNIGIFEFNKRIIDQTSDLVSSYKFQSAFYEAEGAKGWKELKETVEYINQKYPDIPLILDAKRADIESTNKGYVKAIFDELGFDGVTVHPYLGGEALQPFLERKEKGIIILVRTSNPGAGEFQDLLVDNVPLYEVVAKHVVEWNKNGNLGVVVGATYPKELAIVRKIIGDMPILIPGAGAQGGEIETTVRSGINSKGTGIIINSSRGIIFAENPREATLKLTNQIKSIISDLSS